MLINCHIRGIPVLVQATVWNHISFNDLNKFLCSVNHCDDFSIFLRDKFGIDLVLNKLKDVVEYIDAEQDNWLTMNVQLMPSNHLH